MIYGLPLTIRIYIILFLKLVKFRDKYSSTAGYFKPTYYYKFKWIFTMANLMDINVRIVFKASILTHVFILEL